MTSWQRGWMPLLTLAFLAAGLGLASAWQALERKIIGELPTNAVVADTLAIKGVDGADTILGWRELGQRAGFNAAESRHARLRYDDGRWSIANVAAERRIALHYSELGWVHARSWALRKGDTIEIGGRRLQVTEFEPDTRLVLRSTTRTQYSLEHRRGNGAETRITGGSTNRWLNEVECDSRPRLETALRDFKAWWQGKARRLVTLGGGVDCTDRIAAPHTEPGALEIQYYRGLLLVTPGRNHRDVRAYFGRNGRRYGFSDIDWPLFPTEEGRDRLSGQVYGELRSLILGSTYYRVRRDRSNLILEPYRNRHRFFTAGDLVRFDPNEADYVTSEELDVEALTTQELPTAGGIGLFPLGWSAVPESPPLPDEIPRWALVSAVVGVSLSTALAISSIVPIPKRAPYRRTTAVRVHRWQQRIAFGRYWLRLFSIVCCISLCVFFFGLAFMYTDQAENLSRLDLGTLLVINWLFATLALALSPERRWDFMLFWLTLSCLMIAGSLCLELLGVGATQTRWSLYDLKHQVSVSWICLLVALAVGIDMEYWRTWLWHLTRVSSRLGLILRWLPILFLVGVFGLWLLVGRETGLGSFQPMELGKLTAVLVLAIVLSNLDYGRRYSGFFIRFGRFVLWLVFLAVLYGSLFFAIPVLKSDLSPVLMLSVLSVVLLILMSAWISAHRWMREHVLARSRAQPPGERRRAPKLGIGSAIEIGVIMLGLLSLVLAGLWVDSQIERIKKTHDRVEALWFSTPEKRVAVYLSMHDHPELGRQLKDSLELIEQTPCYDWEAQWLSRDLDGRCKEPAQSFGLNPPAAYRLAAVQDDFILAFFINRFGLGAAALLGGLQIAILWLMLNAAVGRYDWGTGDYADDAVRQVLCFATVGGALLFLAHWWISWANALGLWPVMGQPMTFVSAANSHLIAMAGPIIALTALLMRLEPKRQRIVTPALAGPPPPAALGLLSSIGERLKIWGTTAQHAARRPAPDQ